MANAALGVDIALDGSLSWQAAEGNDMKTTDTNDIALVDDLDVVRQALFKRLNTRKGDLWAHPDYGCGIWDILSDLMTDTWYKEAVSTIQECINDDPRAQVVSVTYSAVPQNRQVAFTITYRIISDGRQDNLVWNYAPEAVTASV